MIAGFFINSICWREVDVDERLTKYFFPLLPKIDARAWNINIKPAESILMRELVFERNGWDGDNLRYDLVDITCSQELKVHLLITGGRQ